MVAADNGYTEVASLLIASGAQLEESDEDLNVIFCRIDKFSIDDFVVFEQWSFFSQQGYTALLFAAEENHVEIVSLLLLAGAN